MTTDVAAPPVWHKVAGWLGLVLHLPVLIWYAASGLVAPLWAVITLLAAWVALLVVAIILLRRRPIVVPLVPIFAAALWFAAISAGGAWLGWTA
jgi:hypothetical protein